MKQDKKEVDIEDILGGITEETEAIPEEITADKDIPSKQDTTPDDFLTNEQRAQDDALKESLNWNEEE